MRAKNTPAAWYIIHASGYLGQSTYIHAYRGDFGRLGHGSCSDCFVPHPIKALAGKKVINVACGDTHSIAMTSDGALYGFGRNLNGQLGLGNNSDVLQPVLIQALQVLFTLPSPSSADRIANLSHFLPFACRHPSFYGTTHDVCACVCRNSTASAAVSKAMIAPATHQAVQQSIKLVLLSVSKLL